MIIPIKKTPVRDMLDRGTVQHSASAESTENSQGPTADPRPDQLPLNNPLCRATRMTRPTSVEYQTATRAGWESDAKDPVHRGG